MSRSFHLRNTKSLFRELYNTGISKPFRWNTSMVCARLYRLPWSPKWATVCPDVLIWASSRRSVLLLAVAAHPTGTNDPEHISCGDESCDPHRYPWTDPCPAPGDLMGALEFPSLQSHTFHCGCCARWDIPVHGHTWCFSFLQSSAEQSSRWTLAVPNNPQG